jgi:hypothetical protein
MWTRRSLFSASWKRASSPPNRVAPSQLRPAEKWLPLKRRDGQRRETNRPPLAEREVPNRKNTYLKRPAGRLLPLNVRDGQELNQGKRQLDKVLVKSTLGAGTTLESVNLDNADAGFKFIVPLNFSCR